MSHALAEPEPAETPLNRTVMEGPTVQAPPVTPGKVAMWLFLATEVMFFTGLIGSYVVLRSGSPPTAYSHITPPAADLVPLANAYGVLLEDIGPNEPRVLEIYRRESGLSPHRAEHALEWVTIPIKTGLTEDEANKLLTELKQAGATARVEKLEGHTFNWPQPYDTYSNPLSINLTALNTFFLICSSVTMVLALSAIQRGDKARLSLFLLCTVLIGSLFLSIQIYEYYQLTTGHSYPIGISRTGHFRPDASLFASCFFTMTGFHGAHVAGGVVLLSCILIQSLRGTYTRTHHSPVELAGLYWHFVDLVWIILFTVVYLV
ncbi:MAG TPA: cytochrome c oxidase subunit 3 [Isosphaeraceae bacterium]|jgi:heme/copper-type cytochrome/quinol oxidase subunit 3|nr:cytochrome c oxidase subunit 3 [Isosphaeraceae bacterium]